MLIALGGISLHAQTVVREGLGLRAPTLSEQAEASRRMVPTRKVLPNKLALDRLNADRMAKGLPRVFNTPPARMGQEVVALGATDGPALGAVIGSGSVLATLPGRVDNSALPSFPPIRNQGSIGSCASFSSTYTVATHMLGLVRGTNARSTSDNATKLSPKFIYTLVNDGEDAGSTITGNFDALISFGAPSWQAWPYVGDGSNAANYLEWPRTAEVWREAAKNRLYQSGVVRNIDSDSGLQTLKAMLANGYLLLFGTDIYGWEFTTFSNDPATNLDNDLAGKRVCWRVLRDPSGHAMTIVGYDDNVWTDINRNGVVDSGEKGALKIANSWGTGWEDGGFVWIAYDALRDTSQVDGVSNTGRASGLYSTFYLDEVYWVSALEGYTPTLLAEFTVSHASRDQMRLRLGRSSTSATAPQAYSSTSDLNGLGGAHAFDGGATEKDGTFVFDFTDLQQSGAQRYWLSMSDVAGGASGRLKSFRLTSASGAELATASSGVNVAVNGSTRHALVDLGGASLAPVITSSTSAAGRVGQAFSYTISASGTPISYGATGLPSGLSISSNVISGTPTQAGSFNVALSATNASGTGTATLRIDISAALIGAPEITSDATASGEVGVSFSYNITASNSPTSFGASGLPNGLGVNATTGLISGTPTRAGISAVSLSATNAGGTGTRTLTLSIAQPTEPLPEITSQAAVSGVSGASFLYRIEATNNPTSFGAEGLPAGLVLNSATGVITGTLPSPRVYAITLTASNAQGTASKDITLTVTGGAIQGPPNDDFSNRVPLTGASATASGSTVNASVEDGEPTHLDQASHSAWWSWTAPRTASVTVSLAGSSFDTVLAVYTGGTVGGLTLLGANDDTSSARTSALTFNATVGTTYQIAVDGYGTEQGQVALSVEQAAGAAPVNDAFASASALAGTSASATGSSYDATAQAGEPAHAGQVASKSIWWKWTAPDDGICSVDTIGSAFDTVLAVYTGTGVSSLTAVASDDQSGGDNTSRVVFDAVAGATYFFAVDGRGGVGGAVMLNLEFSTAGKPANDAFADAIALSGNSANATADSTAASAESGEPAHAGYAASRSLWWTWTAAVSGPVRISTAGSDFDTVLAVYSGGSIHSLVGIAANDDANGVPQSQVEFDAVSGTTYRIAVDGYEGASGQVALAVTQTEAPLNDNFANAQLLDTTVDDFASASGSSRKATSESGEPRHAGSTAARSLWWTWTAPQAGQVTVDTAGSEFDTVLAVYTGEAVEALQEVASNDDFRSDNTSAVTFQAVGGTTYRIVLDGYRGRSGQYELTLEQTATGGIYETDFSSFPQGLNSLAGVDGWSSSDTDAGSGTSGVFEATAGNLAAWLGYNAPTQGQDSVSILRDVDVAAEVGPIEFSVDVWIQDSTDPSLRDLFEFGVYNRNGDYLGGVLFDNADGRVLRYYAEDWDAAEDTNVTFERGVDYTLSATIDLQKNTWSATLGDIVLFEDAPLTTSNSTRDLGSIPATWYPGSAEFGDNFMVIDNYRIATTKQVPVITSAGLKQAVAGGDFVYQIEATHSPEEFDAIGLPEGLSCDVASGRITGRPFSSGTSQVTLTAKNSAGTGSKLLLLTVEPSEAAAPVITSSTSAAAKVGIPFSYQITATNAPTSYSAAVAGGGLPGGLSFDAATGLLSGSPATAGNYTISISAINAAGSDVADLSLVVSEPTPEPTPAPTPQPSSGGAGGGGSAAPSGGGSSEVKQSKKGGKKKSSDAKKKSGGASKQSSTKKSGKKAGKDAEQSKTKKGKKSKKR